MISVMWYDEAHTIIHQQFTEGWAWEDFFASRDALTTLLDEADQPVTVFMDISDARIPTDSVTNFPYIANANLFDHPNLDAFVLLTSSSFLEKLVDIFLQIFQVHRERITVVNSREAAEATLT